MAGGMPPQTPAPVPAVLTSSTPEASPDCCMSLCFLLIRNRSTAVAPSTGGRGKDAEEEACTLLTLTLDSMRMRFVGVVFIFSDADWHCALSTLELEAI